MESSIKPSRIYQHESEFMALMVDKVGEGVFKQCESEEFEDLEEDKGEDQFYLQEEEQQEVNSIKTAPFNKFINLGYEKITNESETDLEQLAVQGYNFAYGFNEGSKTVELVEGKLCKAIGVNIFFEGKVYPEQGDRNQKRCHNYQVCYLNYDQNSNLLYSGSNGKSSQIIEWRYEEKGTLTFVRKVTLPISSLGVAFTFKNNGNLYCISKWSLHKQSQLFGFDLQSTRKTRYDVSLGKVMGLCEALDIYLINERGLHLLAENEKGFELVKVCQTDQFATALAKVGSELLLMGLIDGSVEFVHPKSGEIINRVSISNRPILAVKMVGRFIFAASSSSKQLLLFETDSKFKEGKVFQSIGLTDITKNIIAISNKSFMCCLRGGKIQSFEVDSSKVQKITDNIQDKMSIDLYTQAQQKYQHLCYNKAAKKYMYSVRGNDSVTMFQLNSQNKISKAAAILITYPVIIFDSHATYLAAIQEPPIPKQSQQSSQILELYDFVSQKTVFLLKQLPFANCTCIKFNDDGDKLALGFCTGQIAIYSTNIAKDTKEICQSPTEKMKDYNHPDQIESIIWSLDGRLLKTLSHSNLLFYSISKRNDETYEMLVYDGKKTSEKQGLKSAICKSEWTQMGKYNWRTAKMWGRAISIDQYTDIMESRQYLLSCLDDGWMQVWRNPAAQEESHSVCRWFSGPYRCWIIEDKEGLVVVIYGRGALFSVNIR